MSRSESADDNLLGVVAETTGGPQQVRSLAAIISTSPNSSDRHAHFVQRQTFYTFSYEL